MQNMILKITCPNCGHSEEVDISPLFKKILDGYRGHTLTPHTINEILEIK